MSEFISGKEALIALANGQKVLIKSEHWDNWDDLTSDFTLAVFSLNEYQFRLRPHTIYLNGIEVPAPFEPKEGEWFYFIAADREYGYSSRKFHDDTHEYLTQIGAWRTKP